MRKKLLIVYAIIIATFWGCGQKSEQQGKNDNAVVNSDTVQTANANSVASIKEIVSRYLDLKNALVNDNTNQAASSGKALESAFKNFDKKDLTDEQKKTYDEIEEDAREHAEHIGANGGNIEHQREHFVMLSKDIYDLVKVLGSDRPLYEFFCPMANNNKGAMWLSEYEEVKNPYFGKEMATCGSIKETIK